MITINLGEREAVKLYKKLLLKENPIYVGMRDKLAARLIKEGLLADPAICKECGHRVKKIKTTTTLLDEAYECRKCKHTHLYNTTCGCGCPTPKSRK